VHVSGGSSVTGSGPQQPEAGGGGGRQRVPAIAISCTPRNGSNSSGGTGSVPPQYAWGAGPLPVLGDLAPPTTGSAGALQPECAQVVMADVELEVGWGGGHYFVLSYLF
jgi:hypothetical protein